jgi:flagellar biosynthetic protein FliQ
MFQAATQIQEATLSFIPKLAIMAVTLLMGGAWMLNLIVNFTRRLIENIPALIS